MPRLRRTETDDLRAVDETKSRFAMGAERRAHYFGQGAPSLPHARINPAVSALV